MWPTKAFPVVPVDNKSDRFISYSKEDWLRDEAQERAPGTESAGGSYEVDTTPNFFCRKYALHKDIDDDTRANQDKPLDADRDGTLFVSQKMLLKRERIWASAYMTNVWGTNLTGVSGTPGAGEFKQWDQSGATILKNVEDWRELVASTTGYEPNVLICAPDVLATLKVSSEVKDTIKYTQKGVVTENLLAELFGVEKFLVPRGVVNTAAKGKAGSLPAHREQEDPALLCPGKALVCSRLRLDTSSPGRATSEPTISAPASRSSAWRMWSRIGSRARSPLTASRWLRTWASMEPR